ncbi:hypothetical protein Patl1_19451 [Pistacia atlantica]|uniref:Uncharacterized protein n=1 Tax=Pistacia atlantica TaxID=434234 RepID=A0ACC1C3L5_9ROSI|nr:hypothetical protein Patl1_19451 [Pistacia atlantica]
MATPVKVYGPPLSTAVSRVPPVSEKDVDFQLISINLAKGEHKKADFIKIQPFGQVPAFQDENISIFGTNPLAKASIDRWLEGEGQSFNPPSSALVFQLAFVPRMKLKQDEGLIKQSEAKLAKVLDVYEKRWARLGFLAGDEFSLADLSHLPNTQDLVNATDRGELFTSRENVGRWWG